MLPCGLLLLLVRAQTSHAYFTVVGPCTADGACVRSPNYPSNYGSSQSCTITPESPAVGLRTAPLR